MVTPRPGDWKCPGCGDLQFARNIYCRQCQTPRPDLDPAQVAAEPPPPQLKAPPGATNLYVQDLPPDCDNAMLRTIMGAAGVVCEVKVLPSKTPGQGTCAGLVRMQTIPEATAAVETMNGVTPNGLSSPISVKWAYSPQEKQIKDTWTAAWNALGYGKAGGGWWNAGSAVTDGGPYGGKGKGCGCKGAGKGGFGIKELTNDFVDAGALPGSQDFTKETNAVYINGLPPDTTELDVYKIFSSFGAIPPQGCRVMFWPDGSCKGYGFVNYLDPSAMQLAIMSLNGTVMRDGRTFILQAGKPEGSSQPMMGAQQTGTEQMATQQMSTQPMGMQQMATPALGMQQMGMQQMQSMNAGSMSMPQMMGMLAQQFQG